MKVRRQVRLGPALLLALVVAALAAVLGVRGVLRPDFDAVPPRSDWEAPPPGFSDVGPIVDLTGSTPRSPQQPPKTVVLTFEDGPDPRWTPEILASLRAHNVRATFFVVGSALVDHPDLARRILEEGHELGVHGFSHQDLSAMSGARARLELSLTQRALAGATGWSTALARPPHAPAVGRLTRRDADTARRLGRDGYLVVLADLSLQDVEARSVADFLAEAGGVDPDGAVIQLHDGGGDRATTVAALDRLIPAVRERGQRFVTVSEAAGLATPAMAPVEVADRLRGLILLHGWRLADAAVTLLFGASILAALLVVIRSALVVVLARAHTRRSASPFSALEASDDSVDPELPAASVVVPAFNEAVGIEGALRSLADSHYPDFEIVVVDDGSTDATAEIVSGLNLPQVRLIRQRNLGKASALNAGIAHALHSLIVMVDADTVFERDTLRKLLQPFRDPNVGAVSGNTKVGNRKGLLGRWQHIEYVAGFNLDRRAYDILRCMPTIPGAVGAFRRQALDDVGGVSGDTLAEDTDLTMSVLRAGWRAVYVEDARAWTEAPSTLRGLWRQRYRWGYGTLQAMWKHRQALREPGNLGRVALPYLLLFQVLLPLLAPVVDLLAVYGLAFADPAPVIAYWAGFNALQTGLAWYALRLERESSRVLWAAFLAQFLYRQLLYMVVIASVKAAAAGTRLRWHKLERKGDLTVPTSGATTWRKAQSLPATALTHLEG